ncbi:MAG: hypothetical protein HY549_12960 [Elusimicrobia bacterium]|nr:hypothetical protein [Elusimicrobiota bacterium]
MMTFIAVCIAVIAVELGILIVALAFAVFRIQKTARAVEIVAFRLEDRLLNFGSNIWMRALQGAASVAGGLWKSRRE